MRSGDEEGAYGVLAEHRLDRQGLQVKLDKGFDEGIYCVYVEFEELAAQSGFRAARRAAVGYCTLLTHEFRRLAGYDVGPTKDASRSEDPRRKHDLEATFLHFAMGSNDGRYHDDAVKEQFRVAFLRAGQAWDQSQARVQTHRRHVRREDFRRQLGALLSGPGYAGLDAGFKGRLMDEVPALAFPPKGHAR